MLKPNWKRAARTFKPAYDLRLALEAERAVFKALQRFYAKLQGLGLSKHGEFGVIYEDHSKKDALLRLCGVMNEEEFQRMAWGSMNFHIAIVSEFERRFPKAHAKWAAEVDK